MTEMTKRMILFSGSVNPELAEEIAAKVMANADKLMGRTAAAAAPKKLGQVNLTAEVDEDE